MNTVDITISAAAPNLQSFSSVSQVRQSNGGDRLPSKNASMLYKRSNEKNLDADANQEIIQNSKMPMME